MASGERVWRPPEESRSCRSRPRRRRAAGLVQRSRRVSDYHDLEAHYEQRPSVWIEPTSDWGAGAVRLFEIPTNNETNDNIGAFWRPTAVIPEGKPYHLSYRMRWNKQPKLTPALGKVPRRAPARASTASAASSSWSSPAPAATSTACAWTSAPRPASSPASCAAQPAHQGRARQLRARPGQRRRRRVAAATDARRQAGQRNLALPMDSQLKPAAAEGRDVVRGGMPFERPADMPQD